MLNNTEIEVMLTFIKAVRDVEEQFGESFNLDFTIDLLKKTFVKKETTKLFMIYLSGATTAIIATKK